MPKREYLEPLREELRAVEKELSELEDKLTELRKERTQLGRGLSALDPQWAAEQSRGKQRRGNTARRADGSYAISEEKLEQVLAYARKRFNVGQLFSGQDMPLDELGMSSATRSQALNALQERGLVRLDHVDRSAGGRKFFALVKSDA